MTAIPLPLRPPLAWIQLPMNLVDMVCLEGSDEAAALQGNMEYIFSRVAWLMRETRGKKQRGELRVIMVEGIVIKVNKQLLEEDR